MLVSGLGRATAKRCDSAFAAGTLLPFLYNTRTIRRSSTQRDHIEQNGRSDHSDRGYVDFKNLGPSTSADRNGRKRENFEDYGRRDTRQFSRTQDRNTSGRSDVRDSRRPSRPMHDVPFEEPEHEEGAIDLESSTITPTEKRAFETLFSMRRDGGGRPKSSSREQGTDLVSKPKTGPGSSLDAILESSAREVKKTHTPTTYTIPQFPAALQDMATAAQERQIEYRKSKREDYRDAGMQAQLSTDLKFLTSSPTDQILSSRLLVFLGQAAALQLDPSTPFSRHAIEHLKTHEKQAHETRSFARISRTPYAKNKAMAKGVNYLGLLTANLPTLLIHYLVLLREKFPASMHGLTLLPKLKRLGPATFTLAATTSLYNLHLRYLYAKFPTDLTNILSVLEEMDREVYELDDETDAFLLEVLRDAAKCRAGERGVSMQVLWEREGVGRALRKVSAWRRRIEGERESRALDKAREREVLVEAGLDEGGEDGEGGGTGGSVRRVRIA